MSYSISEFAQKLGITPYTLRYYEKEQLLYPHREQNNHRTYTEQDVRWMENILRLRQTHMPIKEIKRYVCLYARGNETLLERRQMLQAHQERLEVTIQKWQNHYQSLQNKIKAYETMYAQFQSEQSL